MNNIKSYTYSYDCIGRIDNDYVDNIIVRMYFGKVCDGTLTDKQFMDRLNELWAANPNYKLIKAKAIGDPSKSSTVMDVRDKNAVINIPDSWPESPSCDIKANSKCRAFSNCMNVSQSNVGLSGPPLGVGLGENCNNEVVAHKITSLKNYTYIVAPDDVYQPSNIAVKFKLGAGKWKDLLYANSTEDFVKTKLGTTIDCFFKNWVAGKQLNIPANWPGGVDKPPSNITNYKSKTPQPVDKDNTCTIGKYWNEIEYRCLCKNRVGIDQPNNQPVSCPTGQIFDENTCACKKVSNITKCSTEKDGGFLWDDTTGQCYNPPPGVLECPVGTHLDVDTSQCVDDKKDTTKIVETKDQEQKKEFPWPWLILGGLVFVGGIITIAAIKSKDSSGSGGDSTSKRLDEPNMVKKIRQIAKQEAHAARYQESGRPVEPKQYMTELVEFLGREPTDYEYEIYSETFNKYY